MASDLDRREGPVAAEDVRRVESALYELAAELRRLPVDAHTRGLHVRALQLKRDIAHWPAEPPDGCVLESTLGEVARLRAEAERWRGQVRTGRELWHVHDLPAWAKRALGRRAQEAGTT